MLWATCEAMIAFGSWPLRATAKSAPATTTPQYSLAFFWISAKIVLMSTVPHEVRRIAAPMTALSVNDFIFSLLILRLRLCKHAPNFGGARHDKRRRTLHHAEAELPSSTRHPRSG